MQKKISTLTGIIIIVVIAVVLFAGVFVFEKYTRTVRLSAESQTKGNNQNQRGINQEEVAIQGAEQVTTVKNCGTSKKDVFNGGDPTKDLALNCLGEAVISCNSASGIVSDVNVGNIKFEIVPSSASCKIKITLGTEEFITESSRKWAANRWIECPKEAVKNLTEKSGGKIDESVKISWIGTSYFNMLMPLADKSNAAILKNEGCSGTLLQ